MNFNRSGIRKFKDWLDLIYTTIPKVIDFIDQGDMSKQITPSSIKIYRHEMLALKMEIESFNNFAIADWSLDLIVSLYNTLNKTTRRGLRYFPENEHILTLSSAREFILNFITRHSENTSQKQSQPIEEKSMLAIQDELKKTKEQLEQLKINELDLRKQFSSYSSNFSKFSGKTDAYIQSLKTEVSEIADKSNEAISELEHFVIEKKANLESLEKELNNQQGLLSGKMLAGGYAQQAEEEKKAANSMRNASVLCLVTILAVVIYSLIELSGGEITIERSLVKLGLLLFLLAPAAYLARESTKHRNEHYLLRQTALDLNAIGPYIATLNKTDQDLLKTKIAERLFCTKQSQPDANTFPINAHEVIIKLIERFEPAEKTVKAQAETKKPE